MEYVEVCTEDGEIDSEREDEQSEEAEEQSEEEQEEQSEGGDDPTDEEEEDEMEVVRFGPPTAKAKTKQPSKPLDEQPRPLKHSLPELVSKKDVKPRKVQKSGPSSPMATNHRAIGSKVYFQFNKSPPKTNLINFLSKGKRKRSWQEPESSESEKTQ